MMRRHDPVQLLDQAKLMNLQQTIQELTALPVEVRLRIANALWNSIPPATAVGVSSEQQHELRHRLEQHDADRESAISRGDV